ncbi:hypothetical protein Mycsm_07139 (plasmid) [Mycobacterium sp. JS623]|nr:hypothetical protein Mycsm_07139 [Mycobacterium sp. JS623]
MMSATPLTDIHLPERAVSELSDVDVAEWIDDHAIPVGRRWWTDALTAAGLDDTLTGDTIRRADIFALADAAGEDPAAALTLLWNALAWGSGDKRRNNKARIAAVAADPAAAAALLQRAAVLSRTDPQAAYDLLYPNNRTAISDLGPAFFTKYLYFAGGGHPAHPCAILDENVALALQKTCGWTSLPLKGWLASAYGRYATLLGMWVDEHDLGRGDTIERWLFEEGKRVRRGAGNQT